MKKEENFLRTLGEGVLTVIPLIGYHRGHSEGIKEGAARIGECYEKKYNLLKQRYQQIQCDIFEDETFLILPEGWDENYWLNLLLEFWEQQEKGSSYAQDLLISFIGFGARQEKGSSYAQDLLISFIDFCLEKFSPDRERLVETCYQLERIREVIAMSPSSRLKAGRRDLELVIEFLDVFGNQREIKSFLSENTSNIPEQAKIIFEELLTLHNEIKAAQDTSHGCNFLILGQTGVGKSSLLNYLIGEKHFSADVGKPVTGKGIHKFSTVIDNIKATVYDSWGIEAGATDEWFEILKQEKQKHDLQQKVSEWFHAIIYCIQGGGARVQQIDTDIINSFLDEKYHVVVVITKADQCSEDDEKKLRKTILAGSPKLSNDSIIAVCSEEKTIRGRVHEAFGKNELKEAILSGYIETIINKLPKRCIYLAKEEFDKFKEKTAAEIDQLGYWSTSEEYNSWLRNKCKGFLGNFNLKIYPKIIDKEIKSALDTNKNLAKMIQYEGNVICDPPESAWWEKTLLSIAAVFVGIPAAVVMIIRSIFNNKIDKDTAKGLKEALDRFVEEICEKLDKDELRLQSSFRDIFVCPKSLQ